MKTLPIVGIISGVVLLMIFTVAITGCQSLPKPEVDECITIEELRCLPNEQDSQTGILIELE
jgi:hypothetical protein